MATPSARDPRIIVIGAGVSGIATAVTLQRNGFHNFTILEKGGDVGGVWYWNRYPGLTCDVPSQLYQFGFAPKPDWSKLFASGPEIQRYHHDVVERFGLRKHLRLGAEVTAAVFTDPVWQVTLADGSTLEADFVLAATGVLHHPFTPDIPGAETFTGPMVHTARWDDEVVTAGKRIGIIGTGSTGVQVVSALQPEAARVVQFARTPQWVLWAPMGLSQPRFVGDLLARFPAVHHRLYEVALWVSGILPDVATRPSWRRSLVQQLARWSLRLQVRDRALRHRLTPDYQPLCKRQVVSSSYYRAVRKPNVELVDTPITRITPTGIQTADGRDHALDVIIFATGFQAHNYMRPMTVIGRDGYSIEQAWAQGPRAYRMTAIPGFPNFFTVLGPNSPLATISAPYASELTAGYLCCFLSRFRAGEFDTVEVTEEATAAFNDAVGDAMGPTVWNTGCNSYYVTAQHTVDLWPFDRATMAAMLTEPDDDDYLLGCRPAADAGTATSPTTTGDRDPAARGGAR